MYDNSDRKQTKETKANIEPFHSVYLKRELQFKYPNQNSTQVYTSNLSYIYTYIGVLNFQKTYNDRLSMLCPIQSNNEYTIFDEKAYRLYLKILIRSFTSHSKAHQDRKITKDTIREEIIGSEYQGISQSMIKEIKKCNNVFDKVYAQMQKAQQHEIQTSIENQLQLFSSVHNRAEQKQLLKIINCFRRAKPVIYIKDQLRSKPIFKFLNFKIEEKQSKLHVLQKIEQSQNNFQSLRQILQKEDTLLKTKMSRLSLMKKIGGDILLFFLYLKKNKKIYYYPELNLENILYNPCKVQFEFRKTTFLEDIFGIQGKPLSPEQQIINLKCHFSQNPMLHAYFEQIKFFDLSGLSNQQTRICWQFILTMYYIRHLKPMTNENGNKKQLLGYKFEQFVKSFHNVSSPFMAQLLDINISEGLCEQKYVNQAKDQKIELQALEKYFISSNQSSFSEQPNSVKNPIFFPCNSNQYLECQNNFRKGLCLFDFYRGIQYLHNLMLNTISQQSFRNSQQIVNAQKCVLCLITYITPILSSIIQLRIRQQYSEQNLQKIESIWEHKTKQKINDIWKKLQNYRNNKTSSKNYNYVNQTHNRANIEFLIQIYKQKEHNFQPANNQLNKLFQMAENILFQIKKRMENLSNKTKLNFTTLNKLRVLFSISKKYSPNNRHFMDRMVRWIQNIKSIQSQKQLDSIKQMIQHDPKLIGKKNPLQCSQQSQKKVMNYFSKLKNQCILE